MELDFLQRRGAARFRQHDHAVDAIDAIDVQRERLRRDGVAGEPGCLEQRVDPPPGAPPAAHASASSRAGTAPIAGVSSCVSPSGAADVSSSALSRRNRNASQARSTTSRTHISSSTSAGATAPAIRAVSPS